MLARRLSVVFVLVPLTVLRADQGSPAKPGASSPLVVERVAVDDRVVTVAVRNRGPRTMTAWGVRAQVTFADGTTQSPFVLVDGYESGYGLPQEDLALAIEATAEGRLVPGLRAGDVIALSVRPLVVVFDDGTASGEEGILEMVFYARQLNGEVWRFAERLVDRLLAEAVDPSDAIAIAKRELSGPEVASLRDLAALRRVRDYLLGPAGVGSVVRGELHERLRRIQQEVRAHRAAADDHSRRRSR